MSLLWRVRTEFTGPEGLPGLNVTHWRKEPLFGTTAVVARIEDFWTGMRGLLTTGLTIRVDPEIDVIDEATGQLVDVVSETTENITGLDTDPPLPWEVQGLASVTTGLFVNGRRLRGRMFIPGLCTDSLSGGKFFESNRGDTETRWTAFTSAGLDAVFCVYSTTHHVSEPQQNAIVRSDFASLRSRRD